MKRRAKWVAIFVVTTFATAAAIYFPVAQARDLPPFPPPKIAQFSLALEVWELTSGSGGGGIMLSEDVCPSRYEPRALRVTITEPVGGANVPEVFPVSGTVDELLPPGQSLWVMVQQGNLARPQAARIKPEPQPETLDLAWRAMVFVGPKGDNNSDDDVKILAVTTTLCTDLIFEQWFDDGRTTGDFPGFDIDKLVQSRGAKILAETRVGRG